MITPTRLCTARRSSMQYKYYTVQMCHAVQSMSSGMVNVGSS